MRLRPRPVSMFCAGSGVSVPDRVLVELHEDEVPVLQEALVLAAGQVVGACRSRGRGRGRAPSTGRTARSARPARSSPSAGSSDDPLARHADRHPGLDRLLVGAEAELLVALEHGDPDVARVEAEALQRELPGELDGALLEVVADREVAEHLEEREVPRRVADVLDVGRAEALLAGRQAVVRRLLAAEEVGLERVHAGGREQHGRVVRRGDQRRRRGQALVVRVLEELEERLADLVRSRHPHASLGRGDRGPADDDVAGQQAGRLARRGAVDRLAQLELEPAVTARGGCARDAARQRAER